MKFCTFLAATTLAVGASAQQACDSARLIAIVGGANGIACTASTGYSPATLTLPSGTVLRNVCSNASCTALLQEITAAVPTECTFNGVPIKSSLVDRFPTACAAALGTTTAPSAANSTAAPNATASPTPTPTPTPTKTNATQSSGSTSGESSSVGEVVAAPGSASRPGSNDSITTAPSTDSSSSVPAPAPTSRPTSAPAPSSSSPELFALTGAVAAMSITAAML